VNTRKSFLQWLLFLVVFAALTISNSAFAEKKAKKKADETPPPPAAETAAPTATPVAVPAATPASTAVTSQFKIGVVDVRLLMTEYEKRKQRYDELQGEADKLQKEFEAMREKFDKERQDYEAKKTTMSADERRDREMQLETELENLKSEFAKRQRQVDNAEEKILGEVEEDIEGVIDQIAQEGNYHLILKAKTGGVSSVLYHSPTIDITTKVLEILNKQQAAASGATPGKSSEDKKKE